MHKIFWKGLGIAIIAGAVMVFALKTIKNIGDSMDKNKGGMQLLETEIEIQMKELQDSGNLEILQFKGKSNE